MNFEFSFVKLFLKICHIFSFSINEKKYNFYVPLYPSKNFESKIVFDCGYMHKCRCSKLVFDTPEKSKQFENKNKFNIRKF